MMSRQPNRWTTDEDGILYEEAMKQGIILPHCSLTTPQQ